MLVGSVFPSGLCHCYLNTIVGSHTSFPFSMTSWVEVARPIQDHMNHCILQPMPRNLCPHLLTYHLMSCPTTKKKKTNISSRNLDLFGYQKLLSGLKCAAFYSILCRLSSLLLGPFSLRVSRLLKCRAG